MADFNWTALLGDILAATNIEQEYTSILGDRVVGRSANANGWITCWAINRPRGNSPSAAFNIRTGVYKDHGGGGECLGFFDFMCRYGSAPEGGAYEKWIDVVRDYAKRAKLANRMPKKARTDGSAYDSFQFFQDFQTVQVFGLLKRYAPTVTERGLRLCGGKFSRWPKSSPEPQYLVTFALYGPLLTDAAPRGYASLSATGGMVAIFQGPEKQPNLVKSMVKGNTGLAGWHGLEHLRTAELIFKVEGLSDMLALQSLIPAEFQDRHVVITNGNGCSEVTLPGEVAPAFAGKDVVLLHDCDRPGQNGAAIWINALHGIAGSVKNVVLPYEIAESHGKDLRDWITEGRTYSDFLELVSKTEAVCATNGVALPQTVCAGGVNDGPGSAPTTSAAPGKTVAQVILERLGLLVLGQSTANEAIVCFSQKRGRVFEIRNIDKWKVEHALLYIGDHCEQLLHMGGDPDATKITMTQLRKAIASEGSRRTVNDADRLGLGIWEVSGRLCLVGSREVVVVNGDVTVTRVPAIDGRMIDFGSDSDQWFDVDEFRSVYSLSEDQKWRLAVFDEMIAVLKRFDNWKQGDAPELITSLMACTFLQTCWDLRPCVFITGPSNCGKTTLMADLIQEVFGKLAFMVNSPTEAGVRQGISRTSKALLIDEFERSANKEQILRLLRSTTRGADIAHGTTGQRGIRYHLQHIPWLGAISTELQDAADKNRFIVFDMEHLGPDRSSNLTLPDKAEMRALGLKLMCVAVRIWKEVKQMAAYLKTRKFAGIDRRIVESYALPVAMLSVVIQADQAGAENVMASIMKNRDLGEESETDEESLIQDILESMVYLPGGTRMTVSEILRCTDSELPRDATKEKVLKSVGIREVEVDLPGSYSGPYIFFSPKPIRRNLLKDSPFRESELARILLRFPGAKRSKQRMGGHSPRGVIIPAQQILKKSSEDLF